MLRRILDSPWFYFGLAGLLVVVGILTQVQVRTSLRPEGSYEDVAKLRDRKDLNVVFVLIDTLRPDHLGAYGYSRATSPFIDSLANKGVRFSVVETQSTWTKSSMASLWTSRWPNVTGVLRWNEAIPDDARMPAEVMAESGFLTAGIYRNGWLAAKFGFAQGFDHYLKPIPGAAPAAAAVNPSAYALKGSDADITKSVQEFLLNHGHERFFLYLHFMDVHQYVYDASVGTFGTSYMDAYDSAIKWVDLNLNMIAKSLHEKKLLDRTIFVISSDHGEAFGEHGREGHGRNLYREATRVPLIIGFPFELDKGIVVDQMVRNVDIMPTIFDLVGLPPMEGADGRSLVPLMDAAARGLPTPGPVPPAYAELDKTWGMSDHAPDPIVSVVDGDYKLIHSVTGSIGEELFDEKNDPGELTNLATTAAAPLAKLEQMISQVLALPPAPWGKPVEVPVDSQQLEQLRALGYIIK